MNFMHDIVYLHSANTMLISVVIQSVLQVGIIVQ